MHDSTPSKGKSNSAAQTTVSTIRRVARPVLHASADSLFLIRMFARAYNMQVRTA